MAPPLAAPRFHAALPCRVRPQKLLPSWRRPGRPDDEDYYLIDAPESIGDGFSFSGGKFADGPSKLDEWFAQGRTVKAHSVYWNKGKAKDPIFRLTMGSGSQFSEDVFRHTLIEMCYLYYQTNIMPLLLIGLVLDSLTSLDPNMVSTILLMGYFSPIVVKYATEDQDKLNHLILVNPPQLLVGQDIFPRLADMVSTELRPYITALVCDLKLEAKSSNEQVYSGFALNAISRPMGKDLKVYIESMRSILVSDSWNTQTTICWGLIDRWLNYDRVEDFCGGLNHNFVELPMAGHHVLEDRGGEELGNIIKRILSAYC